MNWQGVCWAMALALGGVVWSCAASAQTDNPGDQVTAPPPASAAAPAAPKVDHSEPVHPTGNGPKVIVDVDLATQHMHVQFPDGTEEDWPISSGRLGYDTPDGHYKPQWIDPDHVSKQYQDAPMPYAVFFDLKGHAFHGSYQKKFGVAISHGCVRLPVADAKKLFDAVKVSGADITISGHAPRRGTYWARRQVPQGYPQYGYGYGRNPYEYGQGGYYNQHSPFPPYPVRRAYPGPQSFFGALFGGD